MPDNHRPDTNRPDNYRPDLTPPCEEIVVEDSDVAVSGSYYYYDFDLDLSGKVHLLADNSAEDKIYYTHNGNGSWSPLQYAADGDDVGPSSLSVGVDNSNRIHVAYDGPYGSWRGNVMHYASYNGSAWQSNALSSDTDARGYSLDTTASGNPVIAYYNYRVGSQALYVAARGASWSHTQIKSGDMREPHLTVDSADHTHIVYGKYTATNPRTVTLAAGSADGGMTYVDLYQSSVVGGAGPRLRTRGDQLHVMVPVESPTQLRHIRLSRVSCP